MPKTTEQIIKEKARVRLEGDEIIGTILYNKDERWFSQSEVDEIKKKLKIEINDVFFDKNRHAIVDYDSIIDSVFDEVKK